MKQFDWKFPHLPADTKKYVVNESIDLQIAAYIENIFFTQ